LGPHRDDGRPFPAQNNCPRGVATAARIARYQSWQRAAFDPPPTATARSGCFEPLSTRSEGDALAERQRPRLLDLFAGAGGAGAGYADDFDVAAVDITPQPRNPHEFFQADALEVLRILLAGGTLGPYSLSDFDGIHASPPCQAYTTLQKQSKRLYPDLVGPVRDLLRQTGLPYVIENVQGAPLEDPIRLCGTMFPGLRVLRHRLFESNVPLEAPAEHPQHPLVYTKDKRKKHYGKCDETTCFVQVTGGGNSSVAAARDAMGIPWMTKKELNEAIPPAYTRHLAPQLRAYIEKETDSVEHDIAA
jgi:DNA (cytosine-5)-methyltransferase 1